MHYIWQPGRELGNYQFLGNNICIALFGLHFWKNPAPFYVDDSSLFSGFATRLFLNDSKIIAKRSIGPSPFFSICIPQWNRTDYLLLALQSFYSQSFRDFEICISDDSSPDGRSQELIASLDGSGLAYVFSANSTATRYDKNLRTSIGLAKGEFCFLMGNDDGLAHDSVLGDLRNYLIKEPRADVVVTNYIDFRSGAVSTRIQKTNFQGYGYSVAVQNFRNYSFVSGLMLRKTLCNNYATECWDGSEMYQGYLATRIVASGGGFLGCAYNAIRKDIVFNGKSVSDLGSEGVSKLPVLPLTKYAAIHADALRKGGYDGVALIIRIIAETYCFPYAFWLQRSRANGQRAVLEFASRMTPRSVLKSIPSVFAIELVSWITYILVTIAAVLIPVRVLNAVSPLVHRFGKWR